MTIMPFPGTAPYVERLYCVLCKDRSELFKSEKNGECYCESCIPKVIASDEQECPGDKGNHKREDFKPIEP